MGALADTPSHGKSEVLETLHYYGAHTHGMQLQRLGPLTSARWGGDENREGSDPEFEADVLTIVGELQDAGWVVGRSDTTGGNVDLNASPGPTTRVRLTGLGRAESRHPRPRPVRV